MTSSLRDIPEVAALDHRRAWVRIPPEVDVPITPRVRRLIDTPAFRRLGRISQLGLVSLVYPAALHTRFEHSLGVYRFALLALRHLSYEPRFCEAVSTADAELLVVAALMHDIGHWPFCHPIEDIRLPAVPRHEQFANSFLLSDEIRALLRDEWNLDAARVVALLSQKPTTTTMRLLHSVLSGPIDIDKMDYLARDSVHAGVPYGRNFDQQRLIGSLCVNAAGDGLAITEKGKTAAEMMVFARYVMFSEVYWHHSVRAATAMLQRAFYLLYERLDLASLFRRTEAPLIAELERAADGGPARALLDGLFGDTRVLYKRLAQYSLFEQPELYAKLARRPYPWLAQCAERLAALATQRLGQTVEAHEILFDAPPIQREVEFNIDVLFVKTQTYRRFADISPVVRTLAREQFDDYVKRVRVFAHPRVATLLRDNEQLPAMMEAVVA